MVEICQPVEILDFVGHFGPFFVFLNKICESELSVLGTLKN